MTAPTGYNNTAWNERYVERWLGEVSEHNRPTARAFDSFKLGHGVRSGTRKQYADAIRRLDAATNGKDWTAIDHLDLSLWLATMRRQGYRDNTIRTFAAFWKSFLAWARNESRLPPRMVQALRIKNNRNLPVRPVLAGEEEIQLLAACPYMRDQLVIGLLIEAGFRLGELCNLNVGSISFDDKGGAWATLPWVSEGLKTGPRKVYVAKYAGLLHAYLSLHPSRDQPEAPLIYSLNNDQQPRPGSRLTRENAWKMIQRARRRSGVRHFRPHDLRHTSATRFSESGANLVDLCERFGWAPNSKEAATYVHHSDAHKERMARVAAGIDANGTGLQFADKTQQKLAQLRTLWAELMGHEFPPART